MITMPILQFLFLLGAIVTITTWLAAKSFLIACTHDANTLSKVLGRVWRKSPDTLALAMEMLTKTTTRAGVVQSGIIPTFSETDASTEEDLVANRVHLDHLDGIADFLDGNCRHCGQPVPWSRLAPGSTKKPKGN